MKVNLPCSSDGLEIRLGNPRTPVVLESILGRGGVLVFSKGIFVNNTRISRVVKNGRCDPWLFEMLARSGRWR